MLLSILMAFHAALCDFSGRGPLENKNLGFVSSAGHVLRPRAVARFASLPPRSSAGVLRGFPVWRFFKGSVDLIVAGLAGLRETRRVEAVAVPLGAGALPCACRSIGKAQQRTKANRLAFPESRWPTQLPLRINPAAPDRPNSYPFSLPWL